MLDTILAIIVFALSGIILFVVLAYLLGLVPGGTWFKVMPANSIGIIVRGETVHDILVNVPGYFFDRTIEEIVKIDDKNRNRVPLKNFLERFLGHFGVSVISAWWPFYKLFRFKITREKIRSETGMKANEDIAGLIIKEEDIVTDHLRWTLTRPFLHRALELSDGGYIDVIDDGKYRLRMLNAETLSILMRENLFAKIGNRVDGKHIDLTNNYDYEGYVKVNKGPDSEFANKLTSARTAEISGYEAVSIWVTNYQESQEKPGELAAARRKERLADEAGKAQFKTAEWGKKSDQEKAEGKYALANVDTRVLENFVTAVGTQGAVEVFKAQARRDGTSQHRGTLVEANASASVIVQASEPETNIADQTTRQEPSTNVGNQAQSTSTTETEDQKLPEKKKGGGSSKEKPPA